MMPPDPMTTALSIRTGHPDEDAIRQLVFDRLPRGDHRRILVKPNWVKHAESPHFPIAALVTSPLVLRAVLRALIERYPACEEITVGDVPLQTCDWDLLRTQAGIAELEQEFGRLARPRVRFLDLRRERFVVEDGFLTRDKRGTPGDPRGYRQIVMDKRSFLEPISGWRERFRVSDYDPQETSSSHCEGLHRYVIADSVLTATLIINVPKMKTHQKAGITGALKNLVGINGQKSCLAHHRVGPAAEGGDEFPPDIPRLIRWQVRLRDALQKESRLLFKLGRAGWRLLRRAQGIATEATRENLAGGKVYIASGSWYGNDTIWRMVYDLNRLIRYAPASGSTLSSTPQRSYLAVLDGLTAGEGNGPLQPLPVDAGVVMVGEDPFLMDTAMAWMMGLDPQKIACLAKRGMFNDLDWARYDDATVPLDLNGTLVRGLAALPTAHTFMPPPGWKNHIERDG